MAVRRSVVVRPKRKRIWAGASTTAVFTTAGTLQAFVIASGDDWIGDTQFTNTFQRGCTHMTTHMSTCWTFDGSVGLLNGLVRWAVGVYDLDETIPTTILEQMEQEDTLAFGSFAVVQRGGVLGGVPFDNGMTHQIKSKRKLTTQSIIVLSYQMTAFNNFPTGDAVRINTMSRTLLAVD